MDARSLPEGYRLRAPTDADVSGVTALYRAVDLDWYGESDRTDGDIVEEWALPGLDRRTGLWLVEAPGGELAGYGLFCLENPSECFTQPIVHPAHRGRGVADALLHLAEARAAQAATRASRPLSFGLAADAADDGLLGLAARRGFVPAREFLRMEAALDAPPPRPAWPAGIQVRGFRRPQDEPAVHAAMDEAFRDHFRPWHMTLDEWRRFRFGRPDLDLSLWWVAWDGDQVAGSVLAFALPTGGYVEELGVRRPWRGRGLGRALLLHAFAALYGRGRRRVFLGVDGENPTGAFGLYESVGMRPTRRHVFLEKTVGP